MKKTLAHLRNKPEKMREQIAIVAAGVVTLLVIIVWVFSLQNRFTSMAQSRTKTDQVAPEKPLNLLFNSLQTEFKTQRDELKTNNPFAHDETNTYQSDTAIEPTTEMPADQSVQEESAITTDTTTENDPSKDQIMQ